MIKDPVKKYNLKLLTILCISFAFLTACTGSSDSTANKTSCTTVKPSTNTPTSTGNFKFIVFGDFNGGGCDRMSRVSKIVDDMSNAKDIAFYVSTGDIIDGYNQDDGSTTCFASQPSTNSSSKTVCSPEGNIAQVLSPLKDRCPVDGLETSFYPVIGNHDDNFGSGWYPDPCGDGICDFLAPLTPETYIKQSHGDICSKDVNTTSHSNDFYYSFGYQNSYFIILRINNDTWTLLSSCNANPGYPDCVSYCSDVSLLNDTTRNDNCWGDQGQYKWFLSELEKSKAYDNVFVFSHAVSLAGGDGHLPYSGATQIRNIAETAGVDIYFNGHNHAYHRTVRVKGTNPDNAGTMYITTGVAGAKTNETTSSWYSAATVNDWVNSSMSNKEARKASYTVITINGSQITGDTYSPVTQAAPVDTFTL